jgi:hypothetical protein
MNLNEIIKSKTKKLDEPILVWSSWRVNPVVIDKAYIEKLKNEKPCEFKQQYECEWT